MSGLIVLHLSEIISCWISHILSQWKERGKNEGWELFMGPASSYRTGSATRDLEEEGAYSTGHP